MAENQPHSPEASKATIRDLYRQAADYLGIKQDQGTAITEPTHAPFQVKVSADVPDLNGKRLHLEYEVVNDDQDPTAVDQEIPLAFTDATGRNHWVTPIRLKVYGEDGSLLHDYTLETSPDPNHARAYDYNGAEDPETREVPQITSLDAKELIAHLEWALQ